MCSRALSDHGIVVDNFRQRPVPQGSHFFLTHFHTDHTAGLTAEWSHATLHASSTVRSLMRMRYGGNANAVLCTRAWRVETWCTVRILGKLVKVCCVPANHSTGSVMWCFRFRARQNSTEWTTVLHTGDYRLTNRLRAWEGWKTMRPLSMLFFDSSIHDPRIRVPSLDQSVTALEWVFKRLGSRQRMAVIMHTSGVEQLIVTWCQRYGRTWYLDEESCKNHEEARLGLTEQGSNGEESGSHSAADVWCVGSSFRNARSGDSRWVFVKPSLIWFMCHRNGMPSAKSEKSLMTKAVPDETNTFHVHYSNHASYAENMELQRMLQPVMTSQCVNSIVPDPDACARSGSALPNGLYLSQLLNRAGRGVLLPFQSLRGRGRGDERNSRSN